MDQECNKCILCNSSQRNASVEGVGGWVPMWDENQITLFLWLRERKQAEAHVQTGCLSLPVTLPLPLVWPITAQLLGIWAESNVSRTSLMHSLCMKNIKKAQTSTSAVEATGWRLSRKRGWMPPPTHTTKRKWELEYFGFYCDIFILKDKALWKLQCGPLQSIAPCLDIKH